MMKLQWRLLDRRAVVTALRNRNPKLLARPQRDTVTGHFFCDDVHPAGAVYQEFSILLLSML